MTFTVKCPKCGTSMVRKGSLVDWKSRDAYNHMGKDCMDGYHEGTSVGSTHLCIRNSISKAPTSINA